MELDAADRQFELTLPTTTMCLKRCAKLCGIPTPYQFLIEKR